MSNPSKINEFLNEESKQLSSEENLEGKIIKPQMSWDTSMNSISISFGLTKDSSVSSPYFQKIIKIVKTIIIGREKSRRQASGVESSGDRNKYDYEMRWHYEGFSNIQTPFDEYTSLYIEIMYQRFIQNSDISTSSFNLWSLQKLMEIRFDKTMRNKGMI